MSTDRLSGHPSPTAGFGPRLVNQSKIVDRPQQPADGPGVIWFHNRPYCSGCDEPLGPAAGELRPTRVPVCPCCPTPRGAA